MNKFYVYGLFYEENPIDICFYIGKGSGYRKNCHFLDCHLDESQKFVNNYYKVRKIKKLKREERSVYSREIFSNLNEDQALKKEKRLISEIGLDNLTNLVSGGEKIPNLTGEDHPWYGVTGEDHPGSKNKGKNNPMYGKELSDEARKKISKKQKGERSHNTKLTKKEVKEIKWLANNTNKKYIKIAEEYSIHRQCVSEMMRGKTWSHISEELEPNNWIPSIKSRAKFVYQKTRLTQTQVANLYDVTAAAISKWSNDNSIKALKP